MRNRNHFLVVFPPAPRRGEVKSGKILYSVFVILYSVFACALPAQSPISLPALQDRAAATALSALTARAERDLAELDLVGLRAGLLPRLELNGNTFYQQTFAETTQPDGTIRFQPVTTNNGGLRLHASQVIGATGGTVFATSGLQRFDDFEQDNRIYNGLPVRIGLRQPILGFNRWKWDRRLLPLQLSAAERRYRFEETAARTQATRLFFELAGADQDRRIAATNREAGSQLLDIARERFELGKISRSDLAQIELDLVDAEAAEIRAAQQVLDVSAAIASLVGEEYTGEALVPELPTTAALTDIRPEEALIRAERFRPEIEEIRLTLLTAERDLAFVRRDFGPQLDLEASYGYVRSAPTLDAVYQDPQPERLVQLTFRLPLLDWGERRAAVKRATVSRDLAQLTGDRLRQEITNSLRRLLTRRRQLTEEIRLAERARALADERYRISRETYLLGKIPLTELNLAQLSRDRTDRAYLDVLRSYYLTQANLAELGI